MKHYNQVNLEAQNKLSSLRQEARIYEQVGSTPLNKRVGITSAISIILIITFGLLTMNQPVPEVAKLVPEFHLSITQEHLLPMAQTFNPQHLVTSTPDIKQFMAHSPLNMEYISVQSLSLEIEHFQAVVESRHFVTDSALPQTELYFMTATENYLLAL